MASFRVVTVEDGSAVTKWAQAGRQHAYVLPSPSIILLGDGMTVDGTPGGERQTAKAGGVRDPALQKRWLTATACGQGCPRSTRLGNGGPAKAVSRPHMGNTTDKTWVTLFSLHFEAPLSCSLATGHVMSEPLSAAEVLP